MGGGMCLKVVRYGRRMVRLLLRGVFIWGGRGGYWPGCCTRGASCQTSLIVKVWPLSLILWNYSENGLIDILFLGWTTMAEGATPLYYEYQNTGAGAATSGRQFLTGTTTTISKS